MPHVLVVEDDKMNARLFDVILRRRGGFDVTITEDVGKVFELTRSRAVDLVIMDVSLPNCRFNGAPIDGLGIARRLKEDPLTADMPILLATAHAMRGDRERFLEESHADEYVAKPITDQADLIAKVSGLINKRAGKGAAGPGPAVRQAKP